MRRGVALPLAIAVLVALALAVALLTDLAVAESHASRGVAESGALAVAAESVFASTLTIGVVAPAGGVTAGRVLLARDDSGARRTMHVVVRALGSDLAEVDVAARLLAPGLRVSLGRRGVVRMVADTGGVARLVPAGRIWWSPVP